MRGTYGRLPDSEEESSPGTDGALHIPEHRAMKANKQAREVIRAKARTRSNRRKKQDSETSNEATLAYYQSEDEGDARAEVSENFKQEPEQGDRSGGEQGAETSTSTHGQQGFSFAEEPSDQWQALPLTGELHDLIYKLKESMPWKEENILARQGSSSGWD